MMSFKLPYSQLPLPSSSVDFNINSLVNTIAVKISLMANGKKNSKLIWNTPIWENYHCSTCLISPWNPQLTGLYLIWPRAHSVYIAFSLGHLSKIIHGDCLMKQLSGGKIITETNKRLSKNLRRKAGE